MVLALLTKEDTYGYQITKDIQEHFAVSESTLYPVLRRLQKNGIFPPDTAAAPPKKNSNRIAKWIILACTCYIWIPLLTTWYSLLLTALIVLAVIPIALCAALLGGLFTFVLALFQDVPSALMQLGMGLACGGVAALVAYPIWIACKSIVKFALFTTKKMWHFVTKGDDTP